MPTEQRLTGKAAYFTLSGTRIAFTKYSPKTTRTLADATDSSNYDSASDMLWESQIPVKLAQEVSIEGRFNITTTPANVVSTLYSGATAIPVVFGLNGSLLYGHGNYDLSDFQMDVPIDDMVTFTATLKLNGVFTPNA